MPAALRLAGWIFATVTLPLLAVVTAANLVIDDLDPSMGAVVVGLLAASTAAYLSSLIVVLAVWRSVRAMAERAQAIGRGEVDGAAPVQVPATGPPEVARLVKAFNEMIERVERDATHLGHSQRALRSAVRRLGDVLAATHDVGAIVGVTADMARSVLSARTAVGWVRDSDRLDPVVLAGEDRTLATGASGRRLAQRCADDGEPIAGPASPGAAGTTWPPAVAMPILVDGAVVAVICLFGREDGSGNGFSAADVETLTALVQPAEAAIGNARLHEEATRLAVTDGLTDLANRRELDRRIALELERHHRFGHGLALLLVDIDDFKIVNDSFGHPTGDRILVEIARRVTSVTREVDLVARYGGEEIAVLLVSADVRSAAISAVRVRQVVGGQPFLVGGEPVRITCSVGLATVPDHAVDRSSLVAAADEALYRAKRAGKNRVERAVALVGQPGPTPSSAGS